MENRLGPVLELFVPDGWEIEQRSLQRNRDNQETFSDSQSIFLVDTSITSVENFYNTAVIGEDEYAWDVSSERQQEADRLMVGKGAAMTLVYTSGACDKLEARRDMQAELYSDSITQKDSMFGRLPGHLGQGEPRYIDGDVGQVDEIMADSELLYKPSELLRTWAIAAGPSVMSQCEGVYISATTVDPNRLSELSEVIELIVERSIVPERVTG